LFFYLFLAKQIKKKNVTILIASILECFIKNKIPYYSSKHVERKQQIFLQETWLFLDADWLAKVL